jgi:hypothetical protein
VLPVRGTEVCHRPWPRLKTAERANLPADMVGNLVAQVATRCHAEPGDLCAAALMAGSGGRPTLAGLGVGWFDAAAGSLRLALEIRGPRSGQRGEKRSCRDTGIEACRAVWPRAL